MRLIVGFWRSEVLGEPLVVFNKSCREFFQFIIL
jgi:hypothetical protein